MGTVNQNLIVPDVYADLVREKISGRVVVAQLARTDNTLRNRPGETITFPAWAYIGDATDLAPGNAMTSSALRQTPKTATVKMIGAPGVSVYDYDDEVSLGNALDEAALQQGISIARKKDSDLINLIKAAPLQKTLQVEGSVGFSELVAALKLFGDEADHEDVAAIVAHSCYLDSFYNMQEFIRLDYATVATNNGIQTNGKLGDFLGIPVLVSDRLYDSSNQKHMIQIIKKNSLAICEKESPFVEVARDASRRLSTIYTSQILASAVTDESGVINLMA